MILLDHISLSWIARIHICNHNNNDTLIQFSNLTFSKVFFFLLPRQYLMSCFFTHSLTHTQSISIRTSDIFLYSFIFNIHEAKWIPHRMNMGESRFFFTKFLQSFFFSYVVINLPYDLSTFTSYTCFFLFDLFSQIISSISIVIYIYWNAIEQDKWCLWVCARVFFNAIGFSILFWFETHGRFNWLFFVISHFVTFFY